MPKLKKIKAIIVFNIDSIPIQYQSKQVFTWDDFLKLGRDIPDPIINEKISIQQAGKCICLIYTSGTTGNPKACMLSNDNLVWTVKSAFTLLTGSGESFSENDRIVSYLPLSHIAGLIFDVLSHTLIGF